MSAYIVNNETISVIAKAFIDYDVIFTADDYSPEVQVIKNIKKKYNEIGQSLINENYRSVNYRYREDKKPPKFEYVEVKSDEGTLVGCINCYIYQSSETNDFFESYLYYSLNNLKNEILNRLIKEKGQDIPWGYEKP